MSRLPTTIHRLRTLQGHLKSVEQMIADKRDIAAILQQLTSIEGQLEAIKLRLVEQEVGSHPMLKMLLRTIRRERL